MDFLSNEKQTNYLNISQANTQKVINNHREAARHHNEAAKYHFEAARHLESGNYESAFICKIDAVGHRFMAVDAENNYKDDNICLIHS